MLLFRLLAPAAAIDVEDCLYSLLWMLLLLLGEGCIVLLLLLLLLLLGECCVIFYDNGERKLMMMMMIESYERLLNSVGCFLCNDKTVLLGEWL